MISLKSVLYSHCIPSASSGQELCMHCGYTVCGFATVYYCSEHFPKEKKLYKGTVYQLLAHNRHCLLGAGNNAASGSSTEVEVVLSQCLLPSSLSAPYFLQVLTSMWILDDRFENICMLMTMKSH